jgi:lipid-A-disaccharide synthase
MKERPADTTTACESVTITALLSQQQSFSSKTKTRFSVDGAVIWEASIHAYAFRYFFFDTQPSASPLRPMSMRPPYFWFVAGEESGDARAVEVMNAMREQHPDIRFGGAGGARMEALSDTGFDNWVQRAAVVGLWDVLRHYGYFRQKFHTMLGAIRRENPDAVVLVDYPGFNLRLAKALRSQGYSGRILYYISPQVWAWNKGRIPKMARWLDLVICVFPFEAPLYEASGLRTIFTGHPLLEALAAKKSTLPREPDLLGLFPGSRDREVRRIFPVMLDAARLVSQKMPHLRFEAAASSEARAATMRTMADDFPITIRVGSAHELMQRATAGLVCSGTATLEAAFFGLPHALVYRVAWLTFEVGKRLVDVNALGIINILNNYRIHPPADPRQPALPAPHIIREFIQNDATPDALAEEALRLLNDTAARKKLSADLSDILSLLQAEGASARAAGELLKATMR